MCRRFAVACVWPRPALRLGHASAWGLLGLGALEAHAPEARLWAAEAYLGAAAHSPPPQLRATTNQSRDTLCQPRAPGVYPPFYTDFSFLIIIIWDAVGGGFLSAAGLCHGFAQLFGHLLSLFLIHFYLF